MYYPFSKNKGADQLRTAQLICVFVFAYTKSRFSHNKAHIMSQTLYEYTCIKKSDIV